MRITYANVTATLALVLAMSGGAYAAVTLPKNSVAAKQIRSNAVTSTKVLDGSLTTKDFKKGQLPTGPRGPQGDPGPQGPQGPQGPAGTPDGWTRAEADARYLQGKGRTFGFSVSARPYGPVLEIDGFTLEAGCLDDGRYAIGTGNDPDAAGPVELHRAARSRRLSDTAETSSVIAQTFGPGAASSGSGSPDSSLVYEYDIRTALGHEAHVRLVQTSMSGTCRISVHGIRYD